MKIFLFLFLLSWVLGTTLSVQGLDTRWMLLVSGFIAVALTLKGVKYQYIIVVSFLILAGAVWGQHNVNGNQIAQACLSEQVTTGVVTKVVRIEGDRAQYLMNTPSGCRVLITTMPWPLYGVGSRITVDGDSESVATLVDKYPEYAQYLTSQGISATVYRPDIAIAEASDTWQNKLLASLREQTGKIFQEPVSGLVLTMTLGQKGVLPDRIIEKFRRSGTSHVLAISGLHMSLFAGMLLGIISFMPISPIIRSLIVISFLWIYVSLIGFPVSAVRAVCFWTIFLLSLRLGLLVSLPTVAILTATVLISFNPLITQEVGFQLSMSAIIGIGLMIFLLKGLPHRHIINSYRRVLDLIMISGGAALATAPIVMYHFGQISLISVLGNLIVVPFVPFFLLAAIITLMISFITPSIALVISFSVHLIWKWWDTFTSHISQVPGAYFENINISLYVVIVYYSFLAIVSHLVLRKQGRNWREVWQ